MRTHAAVCLHAKHFIDLNITTLLPACNPACATCTDGSNVCATCASGFERAPATPTRCTAVIGMPLMNDLICLILFSLFAVLLVAKTYVGSAKYPDQCTGDQCTLEVEWGVNSAMGTVNFRLKAKDADWIAVGFGTTRSMVR
jgi:hypothetical protein